MLTEVEFGKMVPGKKNGTFIAVTAFSQLYKDYEDPTMSPERRVKYYPVVLMVDRWDCKMGFPGGFVDGNESLLEAVKRELKEEAGLPSENLQIKPLCSHEAEKIIVHAFHCHLGNLTVQELKNVLSMGLKAEHSVVEGTLIWKHLAEYNNGKGLPVLLNSNTLALAVKEEHEATVAELSKLKVG